MRGSCEKPYNFPIIYMEVLLLSQPHLLWEPQAVTFVSHMHKKGRPLCLEGRLPSPSLPSRSPGSGEHDTIVS